jgi:uncharacterized protein (TIGR02145 family)
MKKITSLLVLVFFFLGIILINSCKKDPVIPTLTTTSVTNITITTGTSGGVVSKDGGAAVTSRGVCWSTSATPVISGNHTSDDKGTGSFISSITGLTPNTLYHVRAYATNSVGTAYGIEVIFTTTQIVAATLTTTAITSIAITSAVSGGNISSDGNGTITARGVCWAITTGPTITNSLTTDGTGTGTFTSNLSGLLPATIYYVRAYATNSASTAYGNEISFTTSPVVVPTLTTTAAIAITLTTATAGGNITADGGGAVTARGTCWAITANPTVANSKTSDATGTGVFTSNLTGLLPGTTYHIRAYATNSVGTAYGNDLSFATTPVGVATVTTTAATLVTLTTAVTGGNITADGGGAITARGTCWATTVNPAITDSKTTDATGTSIFTSSLTGLLPGTTYHIRAYATNSAGTAYGNDLSFITNPIVVPTLSTSTVTSITLTTAVSGGNITADGGGTVSARGVCWATTTAPTITSSKTTDATGTGTFISNIAGLLPGTTYYLRAYATNSAGTAYGNEISFSTVSVSVPTLTTSVTTAIGLTTATSGGNITADGGGTVTVRGACWSTTANPTTSSSKTTDGTGTGVFTSNLTGLLPGTTYHVRAYATNSAGTAYGNDVSFVTNPIVAPTLTTTAISSVTLTTAVSGGNITSDGGSAITIRGACWSTNANPTTGDNITTNGSGTGSFASNLGGLLPGTKYYVRAYATNNAGTAYGNQVSFNSKIADVDGNTYNTVTIGTQVWMAENLATTLFNNSNPIANITDNTAWIVDSVAMTPAYCWYNNNAGTYKIYGAQYNWYAANTGNLCPTGWHVPTDAEFKTLESYLGMSSGDVNTPYIWRGTDQGSQMKNTSGWATGENGTNTSGLSALPSGYRFGITGVFQGNGINMYWWTATETGAGQKTAWYRLLDGTHSGVFYHATHKWGGKNIRCVKN